MEMGDVRSIILTISGVTRVKWAINGERAEIRIAER